MIAAAEGLPVSIQVRLVRHAKAIGMDPNLVLAQIFTDACNTVVDLDDLEYLPASIRVGPIRPEDAYGGLRAILQARLGKARVRVQIDVGIGDAVARTAMVGVSWPAQFSAAPASGAGKRAPTKVASRPRAVVPLRVQRPIMTFIDAKATA